jgi:hypothetical protein
VKKTGFWGLVAGRKFPGGITASPAGSGHDRRRNLSSSFDVFDSEVSDAWAEGTDDAVLVLRSAHASTGQSERPVSMMSLDRLHMLHDLPPESQVRAQPVSEQSHAHELSQTRSQPSSPRQRHGINLFKSFASSSSSSSSSSQQQQLTVPHQQLSVPQATQGAPPMASSPAVGTPSSMATMTAPASSAAVGVAATATTSTAAAANTARLDKFEALLQSPQLDLPALRELSWSGIPPSIRGTTWQVCLFVEFFGGFFFGVVFSLQLVSSYCSCYLAICRPTPSGGLRRSTASAASTLVLWSSISPSGTTDPTRPHSTRSAIGCATIAPPYLPKLN